MDIGNDQSIAIYFDKLVKQPAIQFRQGDKGLESDYRVMDLDYLNSKAFMEAIPELNKTFCRILGGEWDIIEKKDMSEKLVTKISAKTMPQLKLIKRCGYSKWSKFDIKFLEWARLHNAATDLLIKLFSELEDYAYERASNESVAGYRWRMIKSGGKECISSKESFTGPWQKNIHNVVNTCKEFRKRLQEEEVCDGVDTMVIDILDGDGKMRSLGPITE